MSINLVLKPVLIKVVIISSFNRQSWYHSFVGKEFIVEKGMSKSQSQSYNVSKKQFLKIKKEYPEIIKEMEMYCGGTGFEKLVGLTIQKSDCEIIH